MKLCYALLISSKVEQAIRLIDSLNVNNNEIVIFVDLKSSEVFNVLTVKYKTEKSIHFVKDRLSINWGDVTQPKAVTTLMKSCLDYDFDYLTLMSESCLPLYSDEEIKKYLTKRKGTEFFDVWLDWTKRSRVHLYHKKPYTLKQRKHRNFLAFKDVLIDTLFGWLVPHNKDFNSFKVPVTSLWWTISKEMTSYMVNTIEKEKYLDKYKYALCADEQMFGEVAFKSPFYNKLALHNKRGGALIYIDWYTLNAPKSLTMKDYKKFYNSKYPCLYARKFDQQKNPDVVDLIYKNRNNKNFKFPGNYE